MRNGLTSAWGISARSALVSATVVFVALGLAGASLAVVLYRSMLSGIDTAAATRIGEVVADLESNGLKAVTPGVLLTDERILAVQIIRADGTVVQRSSSAPDTPLVPIDEIGDGLRIGIPRNTSSFGRIRVSAQTMDHDGSRYTVLVGEGSQAVTSTVQTVVIALAVSAPVVIAVSAAATYLLVRRSMRSVDTIRSRVADISTSDLTERIPVPDRRDEISALAVTMNEMLARVEAGHTAQTRFVGDASHELRSPLATIISALDVAVAHPELFTEQLAATTLLPEAHRMQSLVEDLLLLARADERGLAMVKDDVDLDDLAAEEAERLRREAADLEIVVTIAPTRLAGDSVALSRVLRNLFENAARHALTCVEIDVRPCGSHAVATIGDDGPGIPAADRTRVFDRFVRLDEDRSRRAGGAGIGLAIVREIVSAHSGTVTIDERPGGGTQVIVQLPLEYAPESSR